MRGGHKVEASPRNVKKSKQLDWNMEELNTGLVAIACIILALSVIGNIGLSMVVLKQLVRQTAKNYSYLVLNLALSDLLLALFSIPFDIAQRYTQPVFPFGSTMCKMLWPFQTICSMVSIFTVGALSYQRYRFIVHPCKGKWSKTTFSVLLASIWLLPVFVAGVPYSSVLRMDTNTSQCYEHWPAVTQQAHIKLSFTAYLFILQYVLPLALILWCNVKAILALKRYRQRSRTSMLCSKPFEYHENAVKMLTVIVAVFALFWLPGQVITFLLEFQPDNTFIVKYGLDIGYLFVFANCVANPFIFAYFSKNGRENMKRFVKRICLRRNSAPGNSESWQNQLQYTEMNTEVSFEPGGNLMRSFLELIKTMNKERLKIFLDGTPETVLT